MLTRDEMVAVIAGGGSVLYRGRVIASIGELPPESEILTDDSARERAAKRLALQIEEDQAELAELRNPSKPPEQAGKQAEPETPAEHKTAPGTRHR